MASIVAKDQLFFAFVKRLPLTYPQEKSCFLSKSRLPPQSRDLQILYPDLILILAFKGNFSHTMKTFWFSHLQVGSTGSKSNCQSKLARISRNSRYARLRPSQFLGPIEKGLNGDPGAPDLGGLLVDDSQRSGSNLEGESGKFRGE